MASGDTTTERLELDVVLDPEGLRSQLAQVKQQIGLELAGTSYSLNQTAGAFGAGFNSMSRDAGALINAVMFQPTPTQDLGGRPASILSGLVPGLTAPRSYDVEEWGKLHRDSIFNSTADASYRLGLAVPNVVASQVGFGVGMSAGWAATGAPTAAAAVSGMSWGAYLGAGAAGMAVGLVGAAAAGAATDAVMDPFVGRYMAGQALSSGGARFGIGKGQDYLDSFSGAQASSGLSGVEAAGVLRTGLEQGAFGQVGSAEEFSTKFRSLMRGAKSIAQEMHVELNDAVQSIASMQSSGFGSIESSVGALRMSRTTAALTGITNAEAIALSQAGAGMTVGNLGMSAQYGASATRAHFEGVTLGLRDKTVDMESITQLGGRARAAQAMTMSGLGFLEGPLGRATLLGAYDSETGTLDPSKFTVEPGMAFHQAMGNVFSGANPMGTLLEFAGNRQRVASQASPEEVALAQASTWQALARHINPKGPVTESMLVGAASVLGTNPDVARAIVGTLKPETMAARQEALMEQAALSAQADFGYVGGLVGRGGMLGASARGGIMSSLGAVADKAGAYAYNWKGFTGGQFSARDTVETVAAMGRTVYSGGAGMYNAVYDRIYGVGAPAMRITGDILAGSMPGKNTMVADLAEMGANMSAQGVIDKYLEDADSAANALIYGLGGMEVTDQEGMSQALLKYAPEFGTIIKDPKSKEALELRDRMLAESAGMGDGDENAYRKIVGSMFDPAQRGKRIGGSMGGKVGNWISQRFGGVFAPTMGTLMGEVGKYGDVAVSASMTQAGIQYLGGFKKSRRFLDREDVSRDPAVALRRATSKLLLDPDLADTPFGPMGRDYREIMGMIGSGPGVAVSAFSEVTKDNQGLRRDELIAAAGADKILSAQEANKLAVLTMSAHGVKQGLGRGAPSGSVGGAIGAAEMSRTMSNLERAVTALQTWLEKNK